MNKKLFYYTPVFCAVTIPPYVWLSSNPTNEPTAARLRLPVLRASAVGRVTAPWI